MLLETIVTLVLGGLAFLWGQRFGRLLLRKGATANDLFKGKNAVSLAFLGLYIGLIMLALHLPQLQGLPLEWRVSGMRVSWTILRVALLGFCGLAFTVSWRTARIQIVAIVLLGVLGFGGFMAAESYFLAPIHSELEDNLLPNGVYQQTSSSSCAPAALATVLRLWGVEASESSVAKLAGTSRLGTSMPQLIVALQAIGLDGIELSPTWEQMQQINRPGVLATWLYGEVSRASHAIALVEMNDQTAVVADPAFGKIYWVDRPQFDRLWRGQYVPIFRPEEEVLTPAQATSYLQKLNYLNGNSTDWQTALQRFQTDRGLSATGEIDPETALMLSGSFLTNVPQLDADRRSQRQKVNT